MGSVVSSKKIDRKTPANFEVKNVQVIESMSEETLCFEASLYLDGRKIGHASNHGHGGPDMQDFESDADRKAFMALAREYETDIFCEGEALVQDAISEWEYQRQARTWRREGAPVTLLMWMDESGFGEMKMVGLTDPSGVAKVVQREKPAMYRVIEKD